MNALFRTLLSLVIAIQFFSVDTTASESVTTYEVSSRARTLQVGPTRTYKKPSEAAAASIDGDVIEIDAGVYLGDVCTWTRSNLILRGVGSGRAHLNANGANAQGKGTWVITGSNTTVENIEFSGSTVPDKNGAGIRQEGATLTVRNCYFHDNENGILANAGAASDILVEYSEFDNNGQGDGYSHNMYIGNVRTFTLQHCYSHRSKIGHLVKSRAQTNYILYNRITCEATGTASYEINLPNGGRSYIIGNLIEQGNNADNPTLLSYAEEGASNTVQEIYVVNNTFVNNRTNGGTFVRVAGTPAQSRLINNIFCGPGTLLSGTATQTTNLVSNTPGLVNAAGYDYHLTTGSAAINAGSNPGTGGGFSLTPVYQYVHPLGREARPVNAATDIGAYEFGTAPPPTAPSAPSGLSAVASSSTQINLTWTDNANNETGFKLERKTGAGGSYVQIATPAANATSYSDTGRTANTQYYYRIRATNAVGDSSFSNEANATTPNTAPTAPSAPSGLLAVPNSSTQINLTWTDAANNETGFKLERKTGAGGAYAQIATPAANVTSYSDIGRNPSTQYYYRVRATNAVGDSSFSNEANATTPNSTQTVPAAPSGLIAVGASATRISLTWVDAASTETSFEIQRGTDGASFTALASTLPNVTTYNNDGLPAATLYHYRVRAINGAGASAFSNVASAVTMSDGNGGGGGVTPPGQGANEDFDADGVVNADDLDDDNDGTSDVDELAAGTNPFDASSGAAPTPMTVSTFSSSVKFSTENKDTFSISGVLPNLPANIDLTGKTLSLNVGGATVHFVLNEKGQTRSENGTFALRLKPSKRNKTTRKVEFLGGDVSFKAKLFKSTWSDDWSDEGVNPAADAKDQSVELKAMLELNGVTYAATISAIYSAKAGKMGKMKK